MTKDQFIRRRSEFYRRDKWYSAIYLVLFFGVLIAAIPLSSLVPEQYETVAGALFFVLLFGNAIFFSLRDRGQAKRVGLVCRSCKEGLLGAPGDIAVATSTCPHCGKPAFA